MVKFWPVPNVLMMAAMNPDADVARLVITPLQRTMHFRNRKGDTALILAAQLHQVESVKLLLAHQTYSLGADSERLAALKVAANELRMINRYSNAGDREVRVAKSICSQLRMPLRGAVGRPSASRR